jgi:hypothetical protein
MVVCGDRELLRLRDQTLTISPHVKNLIRWCCRGLFYAVAEAIPATRANAIVAADRDGIIDFWNRGSNHCLIVVAGTSRSASHCLLF